MDRERLELLLLLNVQAQGVQWFEEIGSEWERLMRNMTRPPVREGLTQALALPAGEEIAAALQQTLVSVRTGLEQAAAAQRALGAALESAGERATRAVALEFTAFTQELQTLPALVQQSGASFGGVLQEERQQLALLTMVTQRWGAGTVEALRQTGAAWREGAVEVFAGFGSALRRATGEVAAVSAALPEMAQTTFTTLITELEEWSAQWVERWQAGEAAIERVWNTGLRRLVAIAVAMGREIERTFQSVVQQVGSEQTQLIGAWQQGWERLENLVEAVWLRLLQRVDAGERELVATIGNLLHRSVQIAQSVAAQFRQVGQDLVRGLKQGILSAASDITQAAANVVQGALDRVRQLLGISSPSRVMAQVGLDTMAGLTQGLQQGGPQSVAVLEATLMQMKTAATVQLRQVKTAAHEQAMQLRQGVDEEIKQLRAQATAQIKELELQTRWHIEGMRKGARHESRAMRHEVALETKQLELEMRQHVTAIRQNTDAQIKQLRLTMQTQLQQMSVQGIQRVKNLQLTSQQALTALQVGGNQQTALLTTGTLAQLDTLRGKAEGIMILLRDHFLSIYGTMHEDAILAGQAIGEGLAAGITMRINQIKDAAIAAAVGAIDAAKAALGVHSPSTVFAEIGRNTMLGFIVGVQRQTGMVQEVLRQLVSPAGEAALGRFGGGPGMVVPAAAVHGPSAPGITVVITGNTILNERTVEDLATQVGRVLIQQTRAAYPVMR